MKKLILLFTAICISSASFYTPAETILQPTKVSSLQSAITEAGKQHGLSNIEINQKQTFDVFSYQRRVGTLIQGRGWRTNVHPVCFIAWSTDKKSIKSFKSTIGVDDWDTADCDKVNAVGLISKPDDENPRVAVIYSVDTRGHKARAPVILGFRNGDFFYDEKTTENFQNEYIDDIAGLRKAYQGK